MKVSDRRFLEASGYAFDEVFEKICRDIERFLQSGNIMGGMPGFEETSLSITVLILAGIKTMARFEQYGADSRDDTLKFVEKYFPDHYRWQFKKIFLCDEESLLQYFVSEKTRQRSRIRFAVSKQVSCGNAKGEARGQRQAFVVGVDGTFTVYAGALLEDFKEAVEKFRLTLAEDTQGDCRAAFYRNYEKILETCARL